MGIEREEFRAWLAAKDPDDVVGRVWTSTGCALSHFLNETRGGRWSVGCCAVDIDPERPRVREPLPGWAWVFTEQIDRLRTVADEITPVTAREALELLDGVGEGEMSIHETVDLMNETTEEFETVVLP
ncbi:MAG TPA: hypothetical protein VF660_06910 [Actinomycetota bacterium]|jgi:hypothetical protein